jgi:hypothetical protein
MCEIAGQRTPDPGIRGEDKSLAAKAWEEASAKDAGPVTVEVMLMRLDNHTQILGATIRDLHERLADISHPTTIGESCEPFKSLGVLVLDKLNTLDSRVCKAFLELGMIRDALALGEHNVKARC